MDRIAFLLTCYNRKAKTEQCLRSLFQIVPYADVYLVDDGSTDGTGEMVKENFPMVNLIEGSGDLYWARGMHKAWTEALKKNFDYYVWLNDDIILNQDFLEELMSCHKEAGEKSVITGIITDANTNEVIYGGTDAENRLNPITGQIQPVRNMNGNVVLVPKCVVDQIGIIDPHFHHAVGDIDYGYTAQENGIKVMTTRKAVAVGYKNDFDRLRKWNTNIIDRYRCLYSPMGSHPGIGFYFFKKHFGLIKGIEYFVYLHMVNLLPDSLMRKRRNSLC